MGRLTRRATAVVLCAALGAMLVVPGVALANRTIALNTGAFEVSLAPGQTGTDRVLVANNGDEPLNALVYTTDVRLDEKGEPDYIRPDANPENYLSSPASWIRLKVPDSTKIVANTPYLQMDPGAEFAVDWEIVVPPNATPGDYNAVIFFEMFDFAEGDEGAVSRVSGRIGARIDLRVVGDINDKLEAGPFIARGFAIGGKTPFSTKVRNEGNIDKRYTGTLQLIGQGNEVKWSQVLEEDANVYARSDRAYDGVVKFDGVGFGTYTFRTLIDYQREVGDEAGSLEQAELTVDRSIWVVPIWVIVAAALGIGLPLLYVLYRLERRRSAKEPKGPKEPRGRRSAKNDAAEERRLARERRNSTGESLDPLPGRESKSDSAEDAGIDLRNPETKGDDGIADEGAPTQELWAPDTLFEDLPEDR